MLDERALLEGRTDPPLRRIRWRAGIRIVASRHKPADVFHRVAPPEDSGALHEVVALTDARERDAIDQIRLVPPADRPRGPGAPLVMAAFAHPSPDGGRFNDGTFGAFYVARDRTTAVAESGHHRARFLTRTREPPIELEMRVLEARLDASFHDLRGGREALPRTYDANDHGAGQRLARRLWRERSMGIAFDSVRRPDGACIAVFRPRAITGCRQAELLIYVWDGTRIVDVFEKRPYRPFGSPATPR